MKPFRIFLASPGDVADERKLARHVVSKLSDERRFRDSLKLQVVAWDQAGMEVAMDAALTPQEAISRGLPKPDECDLVLVILWSKIGTPLPDDYLKPDGSRYRSGTEWEFANAMNAYIAGSRPKIWVYRRMEDPRVTLGDPDLDEKRAQWLGLQDFLKSFVGKGGEILGGINAFANPADFASVFEQHLRDELEKELATCASNGSHQQSPSRSTGSRIVHPLQPAPAFVGRSNELAQLAGFCNSKTTRVLSLIGLGGAGKTALVSEFLSNRKIHGVQFDRLFVWSFYEDTNVSECLGQLIAYYDKNAPTAHGMGLALKLTELLDAEESGLLVLDGLERVQRPTTDADGVFGALEDPILRQVLRRLTIGIGRTKCIITSRFPVADLDPWKGKEYSWVDVDQLNQNDAAALLQQKGVKGSQTELERIIRDYGTHALTLDHLASFLVAFRNGSSQAAHEIPEPEVLSDVPQERRLARVLRAYEKSLSEQELGLLCRFSIFRYSTNISSIHRLFCQSSNAVVNGSLHGLSVEQLARTLNRLVSLHLVLAEGSANFNAHPAVRDHFYRLLTEPKGSHSAAASLLGDRLGLEVVKAWDSILGNCSHGRTASREQLPQVRTFLDAHGAKLSPQLRSDIISSMSAMERGQECHLSSMNISASSLGGRPGVEYPDDKETLDLVEELIYHSIRADMARDAFHIYSARLGGRDHLAKTLGDCTRGLRILKAFERVPSELDFGWFCRGAGDLEQAHRVLESAQPLWSGAVLCLRGYLMKVFETKSWLASKWVAGFLTGETHGSADCANNIGWGEAIVAPDFFLVRREYRKALDLAQESIEKFKGHNVAERMRCSLAMVLAHVGLGDAQNAQKLLTEIEEWMVRATSVEHACLFHRARGKVLLATRKPAAAERAFLEAVYQARSCGFGLIHIDLMTDLAECALARIREEGMSVELANQCRSHIRAALNGVDLDNAVLDDANTPQARLSVPGANHPDCNYKWGRVNALALELEVAEMERSGSPEGMKSALKANMGALGLEGSWLTDFAPRASKALGSQASWISPF